MISRRAFLRGCAGAALARGRLAAAEADAPGAAATVHPLADEAALRALADGGNAVDAAVAAALMLGVVDGHNSGLGGGLFLLIRSPQGSLIALDGREEAPAAATRDMFVVDGRADTRLSQTGPLASGVPGALAALAEAAARFGRVPLDRPLERAAAVAEEGFVPDRLYQARLAATTDDLRLFPETAATFLRPLEDGRLRLPELASSLRSLATHGPDWFYRGPFAQAMEAWMQANGGILAAADLAAYKVREREPVRSGYRGLELAGFPPPSSGGIHVAQILQILESFDLRRMISHSAGFLHVVAEAMKLAFADRAHWLGDSDFAEVPCGLVSPAYARELAGRINPSRATPVPGHGTPPDEGRFGRHTTHLSVADAEGWWVACTATLNTSFGSKVVIPGTGIVLNNQMDDFAIQPGVPNAFGLVGADANAVEPGKRPLSSMSPTLLLEDGVPLASVGAAGGPTIISQVVLALLQLIDFQKSPAEALSAPRIHHQWRPDELRVERSVPETVRSALVVRGHALNVTAPFGACQIVARHDGVLTAAADQRVR